jgi:predicted nucleotidyltransferase
VARAAGALAALGVPAARIGVTGSLLVGAAHASSDMDIVVYGRAAFASARAALAGLLRRGDWSALDDAEWRDAWERRGAPGTLADYVRHEVRKHTKAVVEGSRLDLTLLQDADEAEPERPPFRKLGRHALQATVLDDRAAFDLPARYAIDDPDVPQLVAWTATYVGHARAGERVEAHGWLEEDAMGRRRLLVGTSREAPGESIRVLPDSQAAFMDS